VLLGGFPKNLYSCIGPIGLRHLGFHLAITIRAIPLKRGGIVFVECP